MHRDVTGKIAPLVSDRSPRELLHSLASQADNIDSVVVGVLMKDGSFRTSWTPQPMCHLVFSGHEIPRHIDEYRYVVEALAEPRDDGA